MKVIHVGKKFLDALEPLLCRTSISLHFIALISGIYLYNRGNKRNDYAIALSWNSIQCFSQVCTVCVCVCLYRVCVCAAAAGCLSQTDRPELSPAGLRMKADALLLLRPLPICFSLLAALCNQNPQLSYEACRTVCTPESCGKQRHT